MFTNGYYDEVVLDDGYDHLVANQHKRHTKGIGTMPHKAPPTRELNQVVLDLETRGFAIPGFQQISSSALDQKPCAASKSAVAAEDRISFNQVALLESLLNKEKQTDKISQLNRLLFDKGAQKAPQEQNSSPKLSQLPMPGKVMATTHNVSIGPEIKERNSVPGPPAAKKEVLATTRKDNMNRIELLEMLLRSQPTSEQSSTDKDACMDRTDTTDAIESDEEGEVAEEKARQENMQVSILFTNAGQHGQRQALNRRLREDRIKLAQSRDVSEGRWFQRPVTVKVPSEKWQKKDQQNAPDHDAKTSGNGTGHKKIQKKRHRSGNDFSANTMLLNLVN